MQGLPGHAVEMPAVGDALQFVLAGVFERQAGPATRSFTVCETSTSDGPACDATRAPMETDRPLHFPSTSSHSPVWIPRGS